MKSLRAKLARLAAAVVASLMVVSSSSAATITTLDYAGLNSPGLAVEVTADGVFQTIGGAVEGLLTWANFLPATDGAGKVKISNVALTGTATVVVPGVYAQQTAGGKIEAFDLSNNLLLSVEFTSGLLQLTSSGVGSQFTVGTATFGGLFASFLAPTSASNSISIANFSPAGIGENGNLLAGTGAGNGVIAGEQIPEPATMLLLGSGILGAVGARKRFRA